MLLNKRVLRLFAVLFPCFLFLHIASIFSQTRTKEQGVYEYVVTEAEGTVDELTEALSAHAKEGDWEVVAKLDIGVPEDCEYNAKVLALHHSEYSDTLMKINRRTAPYAVVDRINIFNDERGTHISIVNPFSINRTILMDDIEYQDLTTAHSEALRQMIISAVEGTVSHVQYGQFRDEGHIGKTMGIMAGGKFVDQLEDVVEPAKAEYEEIVSGVRDGLSRKGDKWGMHLVYEVALADHGTVVFGSTGTPMDAKSFDIVGSGSDDSRDDFSCPGLAHAGAYPIEVVVSKAEEVVEVTLINVMFRMKMYFEDAGKWAFMKNMRMPGSIEDELREQIRTALQID